MGVPERPEDLAKLMAEMVPTEVRDVTAVPTNIERCELCRNVKSGDFRIRLAQRSGRVQSAADQCGHDYYDRIDGVAAVDQKRGFS